MPGVFDEEGSEDRGDGGGEGEGLGDVPGGGYRLVLDDEEVAVEVGLDA